MRINETLLTVFQFAIDVLGEYLSFETGNKENINISYSVFCTAKWTLMSIPRQITMKV
jgi:hypothetical protein